MGLVIKKNISMKMLCTTIVAFFSFLFVAAQDVAALIKEADRLEAVPDEKAAFAKFKAVLNIQSLNIYALNKCSELCSRIGKRQLDKKLRDEYYAAAKTYAGIALKIDPNNSEANCVMAMSLGRSSMAKTGKEKINNAKDIKKYIDLAIKNDPKNFKAWHILGRWHYEINNLGALEKAVVDIFYGGMPDASLKESIRAFERSRQLAPGFILNIFEMSRAYYDNDEKEKAIACMNTMFTMPNITEDDLVIKEKGRAFLKFIQ